MLGRSFLEAILSSSLVPYSTKSCAGRALPQHDTVLHAGGDAAKRRSTAPQQIKTKQENQKTSIADVPPSLAAHTDKKT